MTIRVFFRDEELGTIADDGDRLKFAGPSADGLRSRAEFYAGVSGLRGEPLLRFMLERLNGQTSAVETTNG